MKKRNTPSRSIKKKRQPAPSSLERKRSANFMSNVRNDSHAAALQTVCDAIAVIPSSIRDEAISEGAVTIEKDDWTLPPECQELVAGRLTNR